MNICRLCRCIDFLLKQEQIWTFYSYKVGTKIMLLRKFSFPSLTLCLSQPSAPVQNRHGLLLMGYLLACLIPVAPIWGRVGWHPLADAGPKRVLWAFAYQLNIDQGPVIERLHTVKPVKQIRVWKLQPAKRARGQRSHTFMKSIYGVSLLKDVAIRTLMWLTEVSSVQWLGEVFNLARIEPLTHMYLAIAYGMHFQKLL